MDGLKGFPEAIEAVFPKTAVQLCIVHMVRYSLNFVSWKLRKTVAADLRTIYTAATVEEAEMRLAEFDTKWGAVMLPILLYHFFRHLAYRGTEVPPLAQKCRPQYFFFRCGNSSNSLLDVRPLIRLMISLGAMLGGQLASMCT